MGEQVDTEQFLDLSAHSRLEICFPHCWQYTVSASEREIFLLQKAMASSLTSFAACTAIAIPLPQRGVIIPAALPAISM
ncbi:MAG: hypothetical protein WEB30_11530 [Cyclobacteriaceae bacterium]